MSENEEYNQRFLQEVCQSRQNKVEAWLRRNLPEQEKTPRSWAIFYVRCLEEDGEKSVVTTLPRVLPRRTGVFQRAVWMLRVQGITTIDQLIAAKDLDFKRVIEKSRWVGERNIGLYKVMREVAVAQAMTEGKDPNPSAPILL